MDARLTVRQPTAWPDRCPSGPVWSDGWIVHTAAWRETLDGYRNPLVIEVGAWMGKTTDHILRGWPTARVVAVDPWNLAGSFAQRWSAARAVGQVATDSPLRQYQRNLWEFRDRLSIINKASPYGLYLLADSRPTHVYIDADHRYESVLADIRTARMLFPGALICGDDWEDRADQRGTGVKRATDEVAQYAGLTVCRRGRFWWFRCAA